MVKATPDTIKNMGTGIAGIGLIGLAFFVLTYVQFYDDIGILEKRGSNEDSNGDIRKVGPIHVGSSAPNGSAAGSSGHALGEGWLDTNDNSLKVWDGSQWISISGGSGGGSTHLKDFGLGTGSVDYGLVTQSVSSSEDWGSSLSLLSN